MTDDHTADDRPTDEHEFIDRRSGQDRRSGGERRIEGRRHRRKDVGEDRRSGTDRRRGRQRRSEVERRRYVDPRYKKRLPDQNAPPVYTAAQVAQVRQMLSRPGFGVTCPVCEGAFTLGPVERRRGESVRPVWCGTCGRGTVVTNCILARVMLVTRVAPVRETLRMMLAGAGHELVEPPDTGAALDIYHDNPADVVMMDALSLDDMDGREFIRRLRTEYDDPRIVVLAPRPSYRAADPSATAQHLGATHIVRMPFTRDDILKAVREARP